MSENGDITYWVNNLLEIGHWSLKELMNQVIQTLNQTVLPI